MAPAAPTVLSTMSVLALAAIEFELPKADVDAYLAHYIAQQAKRAQSTTA
jgi:hypothetical protein